MGKRALKVEPVIETANDNEPPLSRRHEAVIVALLTNPTLKDAATAAGVSEATVWRLLQREDFQKRYKAAQEEALSGALGALQGAATEAINTLCRNLKCGNPMAENSAARAVLDFAFKSREHFEYAERIKQLESALKAREEADARLQAGE